MPSFPRTVLGLVPALFLLARNQGDQASKPNGDAGSARAAVPSASAALAPSAVAAPAASVAPAGSAQGAVTAPAGAVTVVDAAGRQSILLQGKPIYPPTCPAGGSHCAEVAHVSESMERVSVLRTFPTKDTPELVVLFQSGTMGNACSGGPLFFVTFTSDGAYAFSPPIDHCGGPDPVVTQAGTTVTVSVPAHAPNRGAGTIPATASTYDLRTGVLAKTR